MDDSQVDLVIVGHVDHGKSTVIGRLMADTKSLPEGKLDQVRERCLRNSRPFEYAFLLDALKNEQAQGITIDAARCFMRTQKRRYLIHDAPGHVEFLKNMVTGASRAQVALLVIDAAEGIRENSRRHGYILSLLGIHELAVLINKMDLVGYEQGVFERIRDEYAAFLAGLGVRAATMIPIAARLGENIATQTANMPWYQGKTVLEQIDAFEVGHPEAERRFRMPLQDVYKFTEAGDQRRIYAGTVSSGRIRPGSEVRFVPSGKRSTIASIEAFSAKTPELVEAGQAVGFTLTEQIYVKPGELLVSAEDSSVLEVSRFRATVFWMGRAPLVAKRVYTLKLGAARVAVELCEVLRVVDASEHLLESRQDRLERHDVGEVILETNRPIACDVARELGATGRFVIVDRFEIAGCGVVLDTMAGGESLLERRVRDREFAWQSGIVTRQARRQRYGHQGKFLLVAVGGEASAQQIAFAEQLGIRLEAELFTRGRLPYALSMDNLDGHRGLSSREEHVQRLGEMARVLTDAGLLFISVLVDADDVELRALRALNRPAELFVIQVGGPFGREPVSLEVDPRESQVEAIARVIERLGADEIILDYAI